MVGDERSRPSTILPVGIGDARAEESYLELVRADLLANAEIFEAMVEDWEAARSC